VPSKVVEIAEAVVAALNNGAFAAEFEARRLYRPLFNVAEGDLNDLTVSVVPAADTWSVMSRVAVTRDQVVHVAIQQRLPAGSDPNETAGRAFIDSRLELAERVCLHFSPQGAGLNGGRIGDTGANWVKTDHAPIYDPEHLDADRVFTALIALTFKL